MSGPAPIRRRHATAVASSLPRAASPPPWPRARCSARRGARRRSATPRRCPPATTRRAPSAPPPAPGHAGCMALELVALDRRRARTPIRSASPRRAALAAPPPPTATSACAPRTSTRAYALPTSAPTAQTIALVDAYNDPHAEADLRSLRRRLRPAGCTTANGCFEQVNQHGETGEPAVPAKRSRELEAARNGSEAGEAEEAEEARLGRRDLARHRDRPRDLSDLPHPARRGQLPRAMNLEAAERTAERLGATEISNSWGGPEAGEPTAHENSTAFNHPGIVITASAGDDGYLDWDSRRREPATPIPRLLPPRGRRRRHPPELGAGERTWSRRDASGTATAPAAAAAAPSSQPRSGSRASPTGRRSAAARQAGGRRRLRRRRPLHRRGRLRHQPGMRIPATPKAKPNTCCTGARSAAPASPRR